MNGALTGSGIFNSSVTINGTHRPGNSPGVQTFASGLTYAATAVVEWELANNTSDLGLAGTDYDQGRVTGDLFKVATGASLQLFLNETGSTVDFAHSFWQNDRSWLVIALSGSASADPENSAFLLTSISLDSLGQSHVPYGTFSTSVLGGNQVLQWTAVPETETAVLLLLGGALLLLRRR